MREKLIELISEVQYMGGLESRLADHLLANGVIVLPCKVGDTVWRVDERFSSRDGRHLPIIRCEIDEFAVGDTCVYAVLNGSEPWFAMSRFRWVRTDDVGKTVFLTREAAEAALKEGQENVAE